MPDTGALFTFYTLSPLHAGAGESATAIDLPIEREKHTAYPVVHSSGIKGSLREYFRNDDELKNYVDSIFGKEDDEKGSGKVIFTDAKILLFPVRSSEGVFKWITCPFVIERLKRDLKFINKTENASINVDAFNGKAFKPYSDKIILEDFSITVTEDSQILEFLNRFSLPHFDKEILKNRLIVVSDDVFKTLVTTATQIIARNELKDDTKKSANLWYEEVVPADALFYTIMTPAYKENPAINDLINGIKNQILQLGGNETIGYGLVKMSGNLSASLNGGTANGSTTKS
ncbi:MAG: type III-B CRISPR module RAMP protein Cmr4 [Candidatus Firestonebacteria bacterium]|nr:type III-B CRISPR module RAMP protein Cmr4 [Candidatus Firestonebacteria bacterium]